MMGGHQGYTEPAVLGQILSRDAGIPPGAVLGQDLCEYFQYWEGHFFPCYFLNVLSSAIATKDSKWVVKDLPPW